MQAIHGPYPAGGLKAVQIGSPADLSNPEDSRVLRSLSRSHLKRKGPPMASPFFLIVAEREGFEPSIGY